MEEGEGRKKGTGKIDFSSVEKSISRSFSGAERRGAASDGLTDREGLGVISYSLFSELEAAAASAAAAGGSNRSDKSS